MWLSGNMELNNAQQNPRIPQKMTKTKSVPKKTALNVKSLPPVVHE